MKGETNILVVDDDEVACHLLQEILVKEGYEVICATSGAEAIQKGTEVPFDLVIVDIRMPDINGIEVLKMLKGTNPDIQAIMITAYSSIDTAIEAIQEGAYDYISKPFKIEELKITVQRALEQKTLLSENLYFRKELQSKYKVENVIGSNAEMLKIYKTVGRIALSNCSVLILGESGTGKELIARAIHFSSPRARYPFVAIDCAALPESLLESELFGHVKGAFTGAIASKKGLFEIAGGGTCFIDEIGNLGLAMQAKLLRVLQDHQIRRVGGTDSFPVDIRVISATNRDLDSLVKEGGFREDLFYRLNVVTINLPPLRERKEDIPLLVNHFLEKYGENSRRPMAGISQEALELLNNYDWPGNIRELEHVVERAIALTANNLILPIDLPPKVQQAQYTGASLSSERRLTLKELQIRYIKEVLEETEGSKKKAAEILGVSRRNLYRLAKRYGFQLEQDPSEGDNNQ